MSNEYKDVYDKLKEFMTDKVSTTEVASRDNSKNAITEFLESRPPSSNEIDAWKTMPMDLILKAMQICFYGQPNKPNEQKEKTIKLAVTIVGKRYKIVSFNPFMPTRHGHKIVLRNDGNVRLAYRIRPSQLDILFHATNKSGFIMPGGQVSSDVTFDKYENIVNILYEESVEQSLGTCFKDESDCKLRTLRL